MSSIVSNFLINPVARTVRRLSTPFATNTSDSATDAASPDPVPVRRPFSQTFPLDHGDVITECEGPSISFPSLSFLRGPDIALGARSPPLLIPQRRRTRYPANDSSPSSTTRSPSPSLFEMDPPSNAEDVSEAGAEVVQTPPATPDHHDPVPLTSRILPANDGMEDMRRRILSIQCNDIFNPDQKRYLMQQILTENYAKARHAKAVAEGKVDLPLPQTEYPTASEHASASSNPESSITRDLGFGIAALETLRSWTGAEEEHLPIHVSEEDAEASYRYRVQAVNEDGDNSAQEEEEVISEFGCPHYKRNVKVQCAACEKWYTCRLCHDLVEDHVLPRKQTKHMLCMFCKHPQKASDTCAKCGESAASYYCSICKLWSDDVDKHIYHCDDCGICRVGHGLEKDFFHCKTCRACISISTRDDHKCIERATDADCPICGDNMFDSPLSVIFMECGHPIHKSCFDQYMATSYKCPLCNKSIVKMDALFLNLSNIIKEQPMPEDWRNVRSILLCNDCSAKSSAPFHFLGLQCENCHSYNTIELQRSANPANPTEPTQNYHVSVLQQPSEPSSRTDAGGENETEEPSYVDGEDDEDEELDFWGRDPRSESSEEDEENDEQEDGEEEEESEDDDNDDDDDDDDDNEEDIILLGHR